MIPKCELKLMRTFSMNPNWEKLNKNIFYYIFIFGSDHCEGLAPIGEGKMEANRPNGKWQFAKLQCAFPAYILARPQPKMVAVGAMPAAV
jgi:hypothetical protein